MVLKEPNVFERSKFINDLERSQHINGWEGDGDERGYNPETPSNFWNNPKDSTIGWHTHLS